MQKEQREQVFKIYLETVLKEGGTGNFVIFTDPLSEKFVQFVGDMGKSSLVLDVPKAIVNESEEGLLFRYLPAVHKLEYSYQVQVTVSQGAYLADSIFLDVFRLPGDYSIQVELQLN
ncbi:MAG: hypothetical protein ACFFD4_30860 [Candidatus Odinarchaeota archaeon]